MEGSKNFGFFPESSSSDMFFLSASPGRASELDLTVSNLLNFRSTATLSFCFAGGLPSPWSSTCTPRSILDLLARYWARIW